MIDHLRVNAVFEANKDKPHIVCLAALETESRKLETELADMREMFAEYVKAEDAWREQLGLNPTDYLHLKAKKLRKQAKEVLGL